MTLDTFPSSSATLAHTSSRRVHREVRRRPSDDGHRTTRLLDLRRAFVDWVLHDRHVATIELPAPALITRACTDPAGTPGPAATEFWSITEVLYALWDDDAPVPTGVITLIGLPRRTTFSHLVRLLQVVHADGEDSSHGAVVERLANSRAEEVRRLLRRVGSRPDGRPAGDDAGMAA